MIHKIWNEDIKEIEKGNYQKAFELIEQENNAFKERVFQKLKESQPNYYLKRKDDQQNG